jgi:hypothetical protein
MTKLGTKMVVAIVVLGVAFGCTDGDPQDPAQLVQQQAVSECGGFRAALPPETGGADDYCAAELLDWSYDAATETLELTDARALLNCCGVRTMELALVDGVYVVTETDAPEDMGRCLCMCVFDLRLTVEGLQGGIIPLRIERVVTDESSAPATLWEGEIDLGAASGSVTIDPTPAEMGCEEGA